MKRQKLQESMIPPYETALREAEKSAATIEKYLRHVRQFVAHDAGRKIDKALMLEYKTRLEKLYAPSSANAALAAVNGFLRFWGFESCGVKPFKVQKKLYCPEERELSREEYIRLVKAAKEKSSERLALLLESICATGIRVSELPYITVEAVARGEAVVHCKGKTRTVFLPAALQKKLRRYMQRQKIQSGPVFITRTGKPMNRSNIWREMKALCERAQVAPSKVFPHSLRHLFARTFYSIDHDVAKLADLLGHSNINTTRIYIITTGAEHRRKMETMRLVI
ncbi:tyrosine-type recombinase/integrase [Bianquea renquensis]|uniref:Tyrosine-type recombinase/integrase n=1 Tax=Bianquea renquensis TaxID=2763661 RepID=A0A926I0I2_9FIRM|nr:tyrosine-type recombinase/integrase [Bianquea renquensis]MBC8542225.1 tyrosine-type recombinase/integrase [Bianquea renquensis]